MATYLLDTSIIVDLLNGRRNRVELLTDLARQGHSLACCSINVTEVYAGLRPGEEQRTAEFLESMEWYEVTWEIARRAGLFRRDFQKRGITLSLADVTIAAVAIANDLTLMSDNVRNFPMKDLNLYRFRLAH
jgi:predicted nucleic acid-binding protein